jgi:hypothetical protein
MAEKDIIAKELLAMQELDGIIATHLPNMRADDPEGVAQLQQLFNIRYPESQELAIDGSLGPKTMTALQVWLEQSQFLKDLEPGARNTMVNPEAAQSDGRANGYMPFQDTMLAATVNQAVKNVNGMDELVNEIIGDTSIEELL